MMRQVWWILGGLAGLLVIVIVNLGVLGWAGLLDRAPGIYVIDAPTVARIFVEERGKEMSEEDLKAAILNFDAMVIEEAEAIYAATGQALVNKAHMLAGGENVSETFARRVLARWDARQ